MRVTIAIFLLVAILPAVSPHATAYAAEVVQTDWSDGDGVTGPVTDWDRGFDSATGVSWRSIPGQLALSSVARPQSVEHLISGDYVQPFDILAVDIDGDGDTDVLGTADGSNAVLLWLNDGNDPIYWTVQVIDAPYAGANALAAGDLDGDGNIDVVAMAASYSNKLTWWQNDGEQPIGWTERVIATQFLDPWGVDLADVDGDGRTDVLGAAWDGREISWWRNLPGDPIDWTKQVIGSNFAGAHGVRAADIDGDGLVDVVGAAATAHQIVWWRNDGSDPIIWTQYPIRTGFNGARAAHPADIDGDGDNDVVGVAFSGQLAWWRNDGGDPVGWTEQMVDATFAGAHGLDIADLDGDGDLDLLATAYYAHDVAWWRNDGGGYPITWTKILVHGNFRNTLKVDAGDIDGDGDLDILATSAADREYSWWEVTQFVESGELIGSILDTQAEPDAAGLSWTVRESATAELSVQYRTSADPASMGAWSVELSNPAILDGMLERYVQYRFALTTTDADSSPLLDDISLTWTPITGIGDGDPGGVQSPTGCELHGNVPNPFNPRTLISYDLPAVMDVSLSIFDASGRLLSVLLNDARQPAGHHQVEWNGRDASGRQLPSGVYFCRLRAGEQTMGERLVLVR